MGITYNAAGKELNAFGRAVDEVAAGVTERFAQTYIINGVAVYPNGMPVEGGGVDRDDLVGVPNFGATVADRATLAAAPGASLLSPGELAQAALPRLHEALRDNPDLEPEAVAVLTAEIQADVQREHMEAGAAATAPVDANPITGSPLTRGQAEGLRAQTPDGTEQSADPLVKALGSEAVAASVREAGFGEKDAITAASDEELLAITGVGAAKVKALRAYATAE